MEINHIESKKIMQSGEIELKGEFLWGSNYTYLVEIKFEQKTLKAVYKPAKGTNPLWDFSPESLAMREMGAYLLDRILGWNLIPPTTVVKEAPLGPGSLQQFIPHDPSYHYFNFTDEDKSNLHPVVLFDIIVNNADRKGSHVIFDPDHRMWLIDHGLCFHHENKLRTVIWDFSGQTLPEKEMGEINRVILELSSKASSLWHNQLTEVLEEKELPALIDRAKSLVSSGFFPYPDPERRSVPWPYI